MQTTRLQDFKAADIRRLREGFPALAKYLDEEIAHCFECFCEMFHGAAWTTVDDAEFVRWATTAPLDRVPKGKPETPKCVAASLIVELQRQIDLMTAYPR